MTELAVIQEEREVQTRRAARTVVAEGEVDKTSPGECADRLAGMQDLGRGRPHPHGR
jgi:hypothetical protein